MTDTPLSQILVNPDIQTIKIPIFQRPYAWGKEQITQFLTDFENLLQNPENRHFFGLIVYVPVDDNGGKTIDIIDGQQRLTTIIIALAVIRDYLEDIKINVKLDEDSTEQISNSVYRIKAALKNDFNKVKLITENENNFENLFIETIQKSITEFKNKDTDPRKTYENQPVGSKNRYEVKKHFLYNSGDKRKTRHKISFKNYKLIYTDFHKKLNQLSNEEIINELKKYTDTILNDFRIIQFPVNSYERAFEYFEVLNDRGLDVSALDLIKNQCLKKVKSSQRKEIFSDWSEIFSNTLNQSFNLIQFVRYSYMSRYGHITNKQIFSKYKEIIDEMDYTELKKYLSNELLKKAIIFKSLNSQETNFPPTLHNAIHLLKSTKTVQWYSIVLSALFPLTKGENISNRTKELLVRLFEELHEVMFSLNFVSHVANNLEKFFPKIAMSINYENEDKFQKSILNAIDKLKIFKENERLSFSNISLNDPKELTQDFAKNNDLGQMFVFFFKYRDRSSKTDKIYISSLEHTLPQKPTENYWPEINNLSEEKLKDAIYSYGNFFITHSSDNSSYGNKSFKEKKRLYIKNKVTDIIPEENRLNFKNLNEWNLEIIQEREKVIFKRFLNLTSVN